jgi:hypothetical protein
MKENQPNITLSESSARRIQFLLNKEIKQLLTSLDIPVEPSQFYKKRVLGRLKPPRITSQAKQLSFQGCTIVKKRVGGKTHQMSTHNPSKPLYLKPNGDPKSYNLSLASKKVECAHFKEYFLASKRLKKLDHNTKFQSKRHLIVSIQSTPSQPSSDDSLLEWGKLVEERQFQIRRVVKHLTD